MFDTYNYIPLLFTRPSEITAVSNLPEETKNRFLPIFFCRPWLTSKSLSNLWSKIDDAFKGRRFILELDYSKFQPNNSNPAYTEFCELFAPLNGYQNYYNKIEQLQFAIPSLRYSRDVANLNSQIERIEAIGKGLIFLVRRSQYWNYSDVLETLTSRGIDFSVVLDFEWGRDLLQFESWAQSIIDAIIDVRPETEIAIIGSSFPDTFTNIINGQGEISIIERQLFESLRSNNNMANLHYGDWGSSRPPVESTPMTNVPRIDYPSSSVWTCFRKTENEGYREIANRVTSFPGWNRGLKVWGTRVIEWTANGEPGGINTPTKNAAVRLNIHLQIQANSGGIMPLDTNLEAYQD